MKLPFKAYKIYASLPAEINNVSSDDYFELISKIHLDLIRAFLYHFSKIILAIARVCFEAKWRPYYLTFVIYYILLCLYDIRTVHMGY